MNDAFREPARPYYYVVYHVVTWSLRDNGSPSGVARQLARLAEMQLPDANAGSEPSAPIHRTVTGPYACIMRQSPLRQLEVPVSRAVLYRARALKAWIMPLNWQQVSEEDAKASGLTIVEPR